MKLSDSDLEDIQELIFNLKKSGASQVCIENARHALVLLQNDYSGFVLGMAVGKILATATVGKQYTIANAIKDFFAERYKSNDYKKPDSKSSD